MKMKTKTYHNVMCLAKKISKEKGYSLEESAKIAVRCFDESNPNGKGPEALADEVLSKSEWEKEYPTRCGCNFRPRVLEV